MCTSICLMLTPDSEQPLDDFDRGVSPFTGGSSLLEGTRFWVNITCPLENMLATLYSREIESLKNQGNIDKT